ncbi:MAG: DUF3806 domain-containing protein [Pseudomonadota bacterium]
MARPERFSNPSEQDLGHLAKMEEWVAGHYPENSRHAYDDWGAKLKVIQVILDNGWIEDSDPACTWKRQALGAALGSALVQYYDGLAWTVVDDEYGRGLCLVWGETSAQLNPLTMISKRLERGEAVSVHDLMVQSCETLDDLRNKPGFV